MPNCDGFELNDFLKSMSDYRSIPVILVSGQFSGDEDEAISMGFFSYLPKPINEATLVTMVERALEVYSP
jgi:CheY-like chemotaxis protein